MSEMRRLEKVIFFEHGEEVEELAPLLYNSTTSRLLTHEHAQTSMLKRWRSWLLYCIIVNSIYLNREEEFGGWGNRRRKFPNLPWLALV